ncbi:MAG TPA: hypothetical protein VKV17_20050 [Bryobacteraceae bacterium]|nr:hypothetical protein [Bryobacteraceae bacterium]
MMLRAWMAVALFFLKPPFWDARPPEKWSDLEVGEMLHDSPWAQTIGPPPLVAVYLATAAPAALAEAEERVRGIAPGGPNATLDFDYNDYLRQHRDDALILAVTYPRGSSFGAERQQQRMEETAAMQTGSRTYPILGYFPPTKEDPVLRLAFPRRVQLSGKTVVFRLYLPGLPFPEREVLFKLKDLIWRGRLEM